VLVSDQPIHVCNIDISEYRQKGHISHSLVIPNFLCAVALNDVAIHNSMCVYLIAAKFLTVNGIYLVLLQILLLKYVVKSLLVIS